MPNDNINKKLEKAVLEGNLEEVKALLSAGANPNIIAKQNVFKGTLLHIARSVEIVKELISYGTIIDARNDYGETPLHIAAIGNLELVRELLKHGAHVNVTNRKGNTPLNFAVKTTYRNLEIIRELLEYGADINIRNRGHRGSDNHRTPLDNAIGDLACAKLLIKFTLIKNFNTDYRKIIDLAPYKELYNYDGLSHYLDCCVCEIIKMKTDSIGNNFSLYEFITAKEANRKVLYVNIEGIESIRNQVLTSASYPIYHDVILAKIEPSLERARLLNKLSELEIYTKVDVSNHMQGVQEKTVVLDSYSKYGVAQYLSNDDLLNFTVAFYRSTDQPLCLKRNFTESSTQPNTRLYEASTSNCSKHAKLE